MEDTLKMMTNSSEESGFDTHTSDDEFHDAVEDFEAPKPSLVAVLPSKPTSSEYRFPTDEQQKKILERLHFYFGDERLEKDVFLRKRIERARDLYVTTKFVTSLKKLKGLAKDPRDIEHTLRTQGSDLLKLDSTGTKLRRIVPFVMSGSNKKNELPATDNNTATWENRTVLVSNLPNDKKTVESIKELFSRCGNVLSVELTNPSSNPSSPNKALAFKTHRCLKHEVCAFVEYSLASEAKKATDTLDQRKSDWRGMSVTSLRRNSIDEIKRTRRITEGDDSDYFSSGSMGSNRRKSPPLNVPERLIRSQQVRNPSFSDDSCESLSTSPNMKRHSPPLQPAAWVQQRKSLTPVQTQSAVGILRNPRGPDGSRGFNLNMQPMAILCN